MGRAEAKGDCMTSDLILSLLLTPAPLYAPTPKAAQRVLEFFTAQIKT
jgi:hypothetical protein